MIIYENNNKYDLKTWFDNYFDKLANKDCQELVSNISIGVYRSKLFSAPSMEDDCLDGGYYAISNDKSKVIKAMLGQDPGQNFTEILAAFKFTEEFTFPVGGENLVIGKNQKITWQMPNGDTYYSLTIDLIDEQDKKIGNIINWNWVKYDSVNSTSWDTNTIYNSTENIKIEPGDYKLRLNYEYSDSGVKGSFDSNYFKIIN